MVRRFYTQMPTSHTKYQTDFYSLLNEVRQAHSTVNELEERGRYETADEVWQDREILDYRDSLEQANTELRDIRKEETQVILDESLTPEEKRRQMDALQAERNRLLRDVVKYVKKNRDQ